MVDYNKFVCGALDTNIICWQFTVGPTCSFAVVNSHELLVLLVTGLQDTNKSAKKLSTCWPTYSFNGVSVQVRCRCTYFSAPHANILARFHGFPRQLRRKFKVVQCNHTFVNETKPCYVLHSSPWAPQAGSSFVRQLLLLMESLIVDI